MKMFKSLALMMTIGVMAAATTGCGGGACDDLEACYKETGVEVDLSEASDDDCQTAIDSTKSAYDALTDEQKATYEKDFPACAALFE